MTSQQLRARRSRNMNAATAVFGFMGFLLLGFRDQILTLLFRGRRNWKWPLRLGRTANLRNGIVLRSNSLLLHLAEVLAWRSARLQSLHGLKEQTRTPPTSRT